MQNSTIDNLFTRLDTIDQIVNAGGSTTEEFTRLRQRWTDYFDIADTTVDTLTAAVLGDTPLPELEQLRFAASAAAAASSVNGQLTATIDNEVRATLVAALNREYTKTAPANYEHFRTQFNTDAAAFTKAHQTVPMTADPATLINAPEKTRKAWADGQALNAKLNAAVPTLATAAQLAGLPISQAQHHLGLTISSNGLHRRRVWEAWDQGWTALLELGVSIHAPALDDYKPYREPAPIEHQMQPHGIGHVMVDIGPEDDLAQAS